MQGARHIVTSEGVRGLYQGLLPTLLRDVPEIAIQFALYEKYAAVTWKTVQWQTSDQMLGHDVRANLASVLLLAQPRPYITLAQHSCFSSVPS